MKKVRARFIAAWLAFFVASLFAFGGFSAKAPAALSTNAVAATQEQAFLLPR